jgi:hypothetical protein
MSDDYTRLPSVEETAAALAAIAESRKAMCAQALRALAERMIALVCECEREMSIMQFVKSVKLTCDGSSLKLDIEDFGTGADTDQIAREIEARLQAGQRFDKPLRSINIPEEGAYEPVPVEPSGDAGTSEAAGSAGLSAAEVAG